MPKKSGLEKQVEKDVTKVKSRLASSGDTSSRFSETSPSDPTLKVLPSGFETSAHKFELHPKPPAATEIPAFEDLGELPHAYGTKKLFLVARDPHWLYAYWDLSWEQFVEAEHTAHDGKVFLQLYQASGARIQQIHLHRHSREWYLNVNQPDTAFYAEVGYYDQSGHFVVLTRSGVIATPRDTMSWKTHATFVTIPFNFSFRQLFELVESHMAPEEDLAEALARLQSTGFPFPFETQAGQALSAEAHRELLDYMGNDEIVRRTRVGSFDFVETLRKRLNEQTSSGQWTSSLSSPFGASFGAEKERGFFMNVNAELIIYGGTDPAAKVRIDGEQVRLRPDGTFSFHFNFKDGKYHIPIEATSPDGVETREALLSFLRLSAYTDGVDKTPQADRPTPLGEQVVEE
jgi:hypothetical protein